MDREVQPTASEPPPRRLLRIAVGTHIGPLAWTFWFSYAALDSGGVGERRQQGVPRTPRTRHSGPASRPVPDPELPGAASRADAENSPGHVAVHHPLRNRPHGGGRAPPQSWPSPRPVPARPARSPCVPGTSHLRCVGSWCTQQAHHRRLRASKRPDAGTSPTTTTTTMPSAVAPALSPNDSRDSCMLMIDLPSTNQDYSNYDANFPDDRCL